MTALASALRLAASELDALTARFALVGGLAVSVRTEPRFTRDLDLVVAVESDRKAEELVRALMGRNWELLAQVEQDATERFATARLVLPREQVAEGLVADLLFASSGIEREIVAAAEPIEVFPDCVVPVATCSHLLALKVLSQAATRPQDRIDAHSLLAGMTESDLLAARAALRSIERLGFQRGKDLTRELDDLIAERGA